MTGDTYFLVVTHVRHVRQNAAHVRDYVRQF